MKFNQAQKEMIDLLPDILLAKEQRSRLKTNFAKTGMSSITLSLNIPGMPKSNPNIHLFFLHILKDLKRHLIANGVSWHTDIEKTFTDTAGDFFIAALEIGQNPQQLKSITEKFEAQHPLGRLIDVDVFCPETGHVSSNKQKRCYYCSQHSAIDCMRQQRHTYSELRNKIKADIEAYLKEVKKGDFIKFVTATAIQSLLYEVSLDPKPGLVTYNHQGAHQDMNYYSFLNSTAAISPYFEAFCSAGFNFQDDLSKALPVIRNIGLKAEAAMYKATHQKNTQKGIIFLFGIAIFSYAHLFARDKALSHQNFIKTVKRITHRLVENELGSLANYTSHGEKVYHKYGIGGIRQETSLGFPSIYKTAIPYLKNHFGFTNNFTQQKINQVLTQTLLLIMKENNDTNILYRSDLEHLSKVKELASEAVNDSKKFEQLCQFCSEEQISPGGSADLLALSLFINELNMYQYEL